ncbi:hypothetical protein D9M71_649210 [compost metagenome]
MFGCQAQLERATRSGDGVLHAVLPEMQGQGFVALRIDRVSHVSADGLTQQAAQQERRERGGLGGQAAAGDVNLEGDLYMVAGKDDALRAQLAVVVGEVDVLAGQRIGQVEIVATDRHSSCRRGSDGVGPVSGFQCGLDDFQLGFSGHGSALPVVGAEHVRPVNPAIAECE